jgi:hypothetical protein
MARNGAVDASRSSVRHCWGTSGYDRLDELTVSPETISDTELETLFGYQSTAPGDPLRTPPGDASVLLWQRDTLGAQWRREDEAQRDSADGPLPIIDPDLIGPGHFRHREPSDPAFSLRTARRAWITEKLREIRAQARIGATPTLARFDRVVGKFVGAIDLAALAARDAEGADLSLDLAPLDLDLNAYRFLARCRAVLKDGVLLETEMGDVVSILLQVQKRRQFLAWRLQERRASLVLAPSSFVRSPSPLRSTPLDGSTSSRRAVCCGRSRAWASTPSGGWTYPRRRTRSTTTRSSMCCSRSNTLRSTAQSTASG